ncbi:MAG: ATP-binding cassette domain-containing protein [Clostridium sp.]|uniref:ABC transporter ATP-binding protein n=1 Tax=Clostridium sp. TaxID=1506 RepID=UPI003F2A8DD2
MKIIEVENIYKDYGNHIAVDGLSLDVKKGEILGILGPNGAGKSTLIGMICGLIKKTKGDITYEENIKKVDAWKENIGVVPQDFAIYFDLTAEENVNFFCSLYGFKGKELKKRVDRTLEFVGLTEVRKKKAAEFSGGMKRRLNIACAIAHEPKLIIMDEPTVGIDPQSRNHILKSVLKLREEGATIIYTSHYMEEVDMLCDRIIIVDKGKKIAEGSSDELKNLVENKNIYNILVEDEVLGLEEKLLDLPGIEKVTYEEKSYRVTTLKSSNSIVEIVNVIGNNNGKVKSISSEEQSLETVFLALTGKKLRD